MMKSVLLVLFTTLQLMAQSIFTQEDVEICQSKFQLAVENNFTEKSLNEIIIEIGKSFIGLEYEAHTIEKGDKENLVIHLTGLDCYTFLESSLVFARCIKKEDTSFTCYQNEVENIRYRDGKLKDYISRLHYFSEWIYEMDKRGIGENITEKIGGEPYEKEIDFMSTHPDSYERLQKNPDFVNEIVLVEEEISSLKHYYIPQDRITEIEGKLQSGDIIGITTNISGLDISHTAIAIRSESGRIHLLHAPTVGKKIQVSDKPMAEYIQSINHQTGIMVLRPVWDRD